MRVESWREDVREVHLLYAFCFYAVAASATEMDYLRSSATATTRALEQGAVKALEALGPRTPPTREAIAVDNKGVPQFYSFMVQNGAQRPLDTPIELSKYRVKTTDPPEDGYTPLGFSLYRRSAF